MNLESQATILAGTDGNIGLLRISGRATYASARNLREAGLRAIEEGATALVMDCRNCETMDSTFMGVLVMLSQRLQPRQIRLCDTGTKVENALHGLGLKPLFTMARFCDNTRYAWEQLDLTAAAAETTTQDAQRRLMIDAHEALGEADPANTARFKSVINLLKKD